MDQSQQQQQHKQQNQTETQNKKRVVIFVGPHKSASSTVQEFFVQYTTGRRKYRKVSAFQNWRWPVLTQSSIPTRKQLAQLVIMNNQQSRSSSSTATGVATTTKQQRQQQQQTILRQDLHNVILETYQKYPNMVLGTEEFDRIGTTPWSHRNGIQAILDLPIMAFENNVNLDIVVNYRAPRASQWISIWKQLTAMDRLNNEASAGGDEKNDKDKDDIPQQPYLDWICQNDNDNNNNNHTLRLWEYLDCVANPMRLADEMLHSLNNKISTSSSSSTLLHKVYLIDMEGVKERELDISHVSACQVLNVPCDTARNEWVRGIQNRTLVFNVKEAVGGTLSTTTSSSSSTNKNNNNNNQQWEEMEWLFRQRDCAYQQSLQRAVKEGRMEILTPSTSLWKDCPTNTNDDDDDDMPSKLLLNTTFFLELLKSQGNCAKSDTVNATEWKAQQLSKLAAGMAKTTISTTTIRHHGRLEVMPTVINEHHQHANHDNNNDWIVVQLIQWFLVVLLFGIFFRKRICGSRS